MSRDTLRHEPPHSEAMLKAVAQAAASVYKETDEKVQGVLDGIESGPQGQGATHEQPSGRYERGYLG